MSLRWVYFFNCVCFCEWVCRWKQRLFLTINPCPSDLLTQGKYLVTLALSPEFNTLTTDPYSVLKYQNVVNDVFCCSLWGFLILRSFFFTVSYFYCWFRTFLAASTCSESTLNILEQPFLQSNRNHSINLPCNFREIFFQWIGGCRNLNNAKNLWKNTRQKFVNATLSVSK